MEKVGNEADALFDQYAGLANTDTAANEESVKEYEKAKREMENQKSYRSSLSAKKGGFIFLIVLSFVIAVVFIVLTVFRVLGDLFYLWIIFALVLIAGSIALIFYLVKSLNPRIKKADLAVKTMQDHVNALLRECYGQMATLNALLDWGMPQKAIHNAVPLLELDDNFDVQKYIYLRDKYGLEEPEEENISTYHVQSGSILGNPFICLMVPFNDELAKYDTVNVSDLSGRRIHVPARGNTYIDSARAEIAEGAHGVEFVEFPFYTMEVFDACANQGDILLSKEIWRDVYPLLKTVNVIWSRTIPYCLYYTKNPRPAVMRFVEDVRALIEQ